MDSFTRICPVLLFAAVLAAASASGTITAEEPGQTYYYFPSADTTDGRMISQAGTQLETLVAVGAELDIRVPAGSTRWELGIFDGDTGKDASGVVSDDYYNRHWDIGTGQVIYELYADPDGSVDVLQATPLYTWTGNDPVASYDGVSYSAPAMPDHDWFNISLPVHPEAQSDSGAYGYRLRCRLAVPNQRTESSFKIRSTGSLSIVAARPVQLIAPLRKRLDWDVLYPNGYQTGISTYDGSWSVFFYLDGPQTRLDVWDGDFDRGAADGSDPDTDDPDTVGYPPFYPQDTGAEARPEGAVGKGAPPDDNALTNYFRRSPSVRYDLIDPNGNVWPNDNPSGNREWEKFTLATQDCNCAGEYDHLVPELPAGFYELRIQGLDLSNIIALRLPGPGYSFTRGRASLGDTVWLDTNGNGVYEPGAGEPGIAGVAVSLYADLNLNGTIEPGEPFLGTQLTDENGSYLFTDLSEGHYIVVIEDGNFDPGGPLAGLVPTTTAVSQTADGTNKVAPFVTEIVDSLDNLTADFGYAAPAALGDLVWFDAILNGVQDPIESGLAGVAVELWLDNGASPGNLDAADTLVATTTTNSSGRYWFENLSPGNYLVVIPSAELNAGGALEGLAPTAAQQGTNAALDSNGQQAASGDVVATVALGAGQTDPTIDFGFVPFGTQSGSIGNQVWLDSNRDGVYQAGSETPINGVLILAYYDNGDGVFNPDGGDVFVGQAVTGDGFDAGQYLIAASLGNGTYWVVVDSSNFAAGGALENYLATPTSFPASATDNLNRESPYPAVVAYGVDNYTADFGFVCATSGPGTGTPGYWKNHPQAWPVDSITIGGKTYTKAEAISWLKKKVGADKTINMFQSLVSAKLNVLVGNESYCIDDTIAAADAWMATYGPVGKGVKASSQAWKLGEPLHQKLDDYNNGLLCAPHRD